ELHSQAAFTESGRTTAPAAVWSGRKTAIEIEQYDESSGLEYTVFSNGRSPYFFSRFPARLGVKHAYRAYLSTPVSIALQKSSHKARCFCRGGWTRSCADLRPGTAWSLCRGSRSRRCGQLCRSCS